MGGLMEFRAGQDRKGEDRDAYREGWERIFGSGAAENKSDEEETVYEQ
jgi:hypothetical protein